MAQEDNCICSSDLFQSLLYTLTDSTTLPPVLRIAPSYPALNVYLSIQKPRLSLTSNQSPYPKHDSIYKIKPNHSRPTILSLLLFHLSPSQPTNTLRLLSTSSPQPTSLSPLPFIPPNTPPTLS